MKTKHLQEIDELTKGSPRTVIVPIFRNSILRSPKKVHRSVTEIADVMKVKGYDLVKIRGANLGGFGYLTFEKENQWTDSSSSSTSDAC